MLNEWFLGKVLDAGLDSLLAKALSQKLWIAIEKWSVDELPKGFLQTPQSLFPGDIELDIDDREALRDVIVRLKRNEQINEATWITILNEQIAFVRENIEEPAPFFGLTDETLNPLIRSLAKLIEKTCAQDDAIARESIRKIGDDVSAMKGDLAQLVGQSGNIAGANPLGTNRLAEALTWQESNDHSTNIPQGRSPSNSGIVIEGLATSIKVLNAQVDEQGKKVEERTLQIVDTRVAALIDLFKRQEFRAATLLAIELQEWFDVTSKDCNDQAKTRINTILGKVAVFNQSDIGTQNQSLKKAREYFDLASATVDVMNPDDVRQLAGLEIQLLAAAEDWAAVDKVLGRFDDPNATNTKLQLFLDIGQPENALTLLESVGLNVKWCETAIVVYAGSGNFDSARSAFQFCESNADQLLIDKCRLAFCQGVFRQVNSPDGEPFTPTSMSEEQAKLLEECIQILHPIVASTSARNISEQLRESAVSIAAISNRFLKRWDQYLELVELLSNAEPPSIEFAKICSRGERAVPPDLPSRLRDTYPMLLEPNILAFQLECSGKIKPTEATAISLFDLAKTNDDKLRVAGELYSEFNADNNQIRSAVEKSLGKGHAITKLFEIILRLERGDKSVAVSDIEAMPERFAITKIQILAAWYELNDEPRNAIKEYERVGQLMAEPMYLKLAAKTAYGIKDLAGVVRNLEAVLGISPNDKMAIHNLATTYSQIDDYQNASKYYKLLVHLEPENEDRRVFFADSLALSNRLREAIDVAKEAVAKFPESFRPLLQLARLLADNDQLNEALGLLSGSQSQFTESIEYHAATMNIAYLAGNDGAASVAMQNILRLQSKNGSAPKLLEAKSIEEFIEFADGAREQRRFVQEQVLKGAIPWIFAEKMVGNVPIWGWQVRTQELAWIADDPLEISAFSIYATNGFGHFFDEESKLSLLPPRPPERGTEIVADLSFLITVFKLGLHRFLGDVFKTVRIPSSYQATVLEELGRLRPHQKSKLDTAITINRLINEGRLKSVDGTADFVELNAYSSDQPDGKLSWKSLNLILTKAEVGKETKDVVEHMFASAWSKSGDEGIGDDRTIPDNVVVDLPTLESFISHGFFDVIQQLFGELFVYESAIRDVDRSLENFKLLDNLKGFQVDVWEHLKADPILFEIATVFVERHENEVEGEGRLNIFDSIRLSEQESLSLAVDDRVIQHAVLSKQPGNRDAAFSTFEYVLLLNECQIVDDTATAKAILDLVNWRYKFLVIPSEILTTIYHEFSKEKMNQVARYVQDCVRDPGLFSGPEPTDPPMAMAARFVTSWMKEISHFIVGLWLNNNEDRAKTTFWCLTELLPSIPRSMSPRMFHSPDLVNIIVVTNAMLKLNNTADHKLANDCLEAIRHGLSISRDELIKIGAKLIDVA